MKELVDRVKAGPVQRRALFIFLIHHKKKKEKSSLSL